MSCPGHPECSLTSVAMTPAPHRGHLDRRLRREVLIVWRRPVNRAIVRSRILDGVALGSRKAS
jgi:hypothetical protein